MAHVEFIYDIGSKEAQEIKADVYTVIIDGIAVNALNFFESPTDEYEYGYERAYSQDVRDRVLEEVKLLVEDRHFVNIQAMAPERIAEILEGEVAVNEAARHGRYKGSNPCFGYWFENQLRNAAYWARQDKEGLVIAQVLFAMLCHIHDTGFFNDMTMSWKEAVRTGRKDIFINNLTEVFAVA